jgi:plasmid maintenance system antidote protein VapI
LGVTRQTLNNLVIGKSGISADMAIRLDKAFGGGAETWLRLQTAYGLAQARQRLGWAEYREVHQFGARRRRWVSLEAKPILRRLIGAHRKRTSLWPSGAK